MFTEMPLVDWVSFLWASISWVSWHHSRTWSVAIFTYGSKLGRCSRHLIVVVVQAWVPGGGARAAMQLALALRIWAGPAPMIEES